jgi:hypothetical protein
MISLPLAHVAGFPLEETLGSFAPPLLLGLGMAWANLRRHVPRLRSPASHDAHAEQDAAEGAGRPS